MTHPQHRIFPLRCALFCLAVSMALTSCIKDEALNAECDITGIDATWTAAHSGTIIGQPIVRNNLVAVTIKKGTDRTALDPRFTLTPGARLTYTDADGNETEGNGATRNFATPQRYTTHSEDGMWAKDYHVAFNYPVPLGTCSFEDFRLDASGRYYTWFERDTLDGDDGERPCWASGNGGYAITGMGKNPADFPTSVLTPGYRGNGVRLVTRSTGSFGAMAKKPIAAGNLFIGEFITGIAMSKPLRATRFGLQLVGGRPLYFEGYYTYTPGDLYTDENQVPHPEVRDTCSIYSVLYEVEPDNVVPLYGDDVLTSPRIVAVARLADPGEPTEWTHFRLPFVMQPGKTFSEERLRRDGYAIAIVASASQDGDYFRGAVGSELCIDELRIVWEGEE